MAFDHKQEILTLSVSAWPLVCNMDSQHPFTGLTASLEVEENLIKNEWQTLQSGDLENKTKNAKSWGKFWDFLVA